MNSANFDSAVSASGSLRCAGASIDITPDHSVPLAGVEGRNEGWQSVTSRLEANALLLGEGDDRVLFISADLLYFGAALVDAVRRCAAACGIRSDAVILAASHTHFAPATDRSKPRLGRVDAAYASQLERKLRELVERVCSAPRKRVRLQLIRAACDLNVNRRRRWPFPTWTRDGFSVNPTTIMASAPDAARDAYIDVLRFVDDTGRLLGVLWKFACHPVCFPQALSVCAEYPGHARAALRKRLAQDIPVVFMQGFTGDVRPRLQGTFGVKDRLRALRRGPGFGEVSLLQWHEWADRLATQFCALACASNGQVVDSNIAASAMQLPMADLLEAGLNPQAIARPMELQRVTFGDKLEILIIAAEVCSPYLAEFGAGDTTICVGYAGHVFGYLPSQCQAGEGGYEGGAYFSRFGLHGHLRPGFQHSVVTAVARLRSRPA